MNLYEAELKIKSLMIKHNLTGWRFHFDIARSRFGRCNYYTKTITLSKYLTELNDEERVTDTMLHEIAHALVHTRYGTRGHSHTWKAVCNEIGCSGRRTYNLTNTLTPPSRYVFECPKCLRTVHVNRFLNSACGKCCRDYNGGKFTSEYKFRVKERN